MSEDHKRRPEERVRIDQYWLILFATMLGLICGTATVHIKNSSPSVTAAQSRKAPPAVLHCREVLSLEERSDGVYDMAVRSMDPGSDFAYDSRIVIGLEDLKFIAASVLKRTEPIEDEPRPLTEDEFTELQVGLRKRIDDRDQYEMDAGDDQVYPVKRNIDMRNIPLRQTKDSQ